MLDTILDRLRNSTSLFQVVEAAPSGAAVASLEAARASEALKDMLEGVLGDVYPVEVPEGARPRSAGADSVYRLVSADPIEVEGVRVITAVSFVVTVRASEYSRLMSSLAGIESALVGSDDAISITDAAMDFDTKNSLYLAAIELIFAVPSVSVNGGSWPALLVGASLFKGKPSVYDNVVRQAVSREYNFTLVTASDDLPELRLELQCALLGWQQSQRDYEFEFLTGAPISLPGGLFAWRDVYVDATYVAA